MEVFDMAKDHGSSVKDDKQYEGLRKKGSGSSRSRKSSGSGSGGNKAQKAAAGGKGGKKSNS
jgi:hypothetical protein